MSLPRIAIIALDINNNDPYISGYKKLTSRQKIIRIANRIRYICKQLKAKEPDALWIIAWREYGVTQKTNRAIIKKIKDLFKVTMQKLVNEFTPNLTIIGGTIPTKKKINNLSKLENIKKYYSDYGWVKQEEIESYFRDEEEKVSSLQQNNVKNITILRNTCYIFSHQAIWRHDKVTPIEEGKKNSTLVLSSAIFQPSNKKNNNSYYELIHPFTNSSISIGIEICREHGFSVLKKTAQKKPLLHFVLSDAIDLNLEKVYGEYIIHLDSRCKPRLILSKNEDVHKLPIHFYQTNLTINKKNLMGPLQPLYPLQNRITDKLDELIRQLPEKKKEFVKSFRRLFLSSCSQQSMHLKINRWLEINKNTLRPDSQITFFAANFSMQNWLTEVAEILNNDPHKLKKTLDYTDKQDASLLIPLDAVNHLQVKTPRLSILQK